jgi:hypothetical protein
MGGLYIEANVSNKFAVLPEILFSSMGTSDNDSEITVPFSYLSLPVLLRYNLTPKFNICAGPQFGVLLSAKINDGSSSVNIKENYKGTDWGASFGVGSQFGKFDVGARYYLGLSNIQDNTTLVESCKNFGFQVFMGYRLSEVFED